MVDHLNKDATNRFIFQLVKRLESNDEYFVPEISLVNLYKFVESNNSTSPFLGTDNFQYWYFGDEFDNLNKSRLLNLPFELIRDIIVIYKARDNIKKGPLCFAAKNRVYEEKSDLFWKSMCSAFKRKPPVYSVVKKSPDFVTITFKPTIRPRIKTSSIVTSSFPPEETSFSQTETLSSSSEDTIESTESTISVPRKPITSSHHLLPSSSKEKVLKVFVYDDSGDNADNRYLESKRCELQRMKPGGFILSEILTCLKRSSLIVINPGPSIKLGMIGYILDHNEKSYRLPVMVIYPTRDFFDQLKSDFRRRGIDDYSNVRFFKDIKSLTDSKDFTDLFSD